MRFVETLEGDFVNLSNFHKATPVKGCPGYFELHSTSYPEVYVHEFELYAVSRERFVIPAAPGLIAINPLLSNEDENEFIGTVTAWLIDIDRCVRPIIPSCTNERAEYCILFPDGHVEKFANSCDDGEYFESLDAFKSWQNEANNG